MPSLLMQSWDTDRQQVVERQEWPTVDFREATEILRADLDLSGDIEFSSEVLRQWTTVHIARVPIGKIIEEFFYLP